MTLIAENFENVRTVIAKTAQAYDRDPVSVTLVAVSKKQPQEKLMEALALGHRVFGENRVQEAQEHWAALKSQYPDLSLHLIGPLQTNKAKEAVALFDVIETVDRPDIVRALAKEMKKQNRFPACLVQVNTGEEEQKAGVLPSDLPTLLDLCKEEGLPVSGLMCIPPVDDPAAVHFAFLRKLACRHGLPRLSMGMSADYEQAIPLGASYVRVGTALFGER